MPMLGAWGLPQTHSGSGSFGFRHELWLFPSLSFVVLRPLEKAAGESKVLEVS